MTSLLINGLNKLGARQNHRQRELQEKRMGNVPLQSEPDKHRVKERAVSVSDISRAGILLYEA